MRARRAMVFVAGMLTASVLTPPTTAVSAQSADLKYVDGEHALKLEAHRPEFWSGTLEQNRRMDDSAAEGAPTLALWLASVLVDGGADYPAASCVVRDCVQFRLEVTEPGLPLRVALDVPLPRPEPNGSDWNIVDLSLTAPDGSEYWAPRVSEGFEGTSVGVKLANFSPEVRVEDALPGVWVATIFKKAIFKDTPYRMRALHGLRPRSAGIPADKVLSPNMRVFPPYAFTFSHAEANEQGCFDNEKHYEDHSVRCLRFSFGHVNAGDGPLDLVFTPSDNPSDECPVWQIRYRVDGTPSERTPAGKCTFHVARDHDHYHHEDLFFAQLFRRDLVTGELSEVPADSTKLGACGHDWKITRWRSFFQGVAGTFDSGADCNKDTTGMGGERRFGLTPGFGDIYYFSQTDNYLPFPAGELAVDQVAEYVVRGIADVGGSIIESDEADNVSYSLIRVAHQPEGRFTVDLLERGYGTGPDDPDKEVVDEWDRATTNYEGP